MLPYTNQPNQQHVSILSQEVNILYNAGELLKQLENQTLTDLKLLEDKLTNNKKNLQDNLFQKPGQDKTKANIEQNRGDFSICALQLETQMQNQLSDIRKKNKLIMLEVEKAHKALERYAATKRKLNKNSGKELGYIQDIDELREKAYTLNQKLMEHENKIQFQEEYTDCSKSPRIQDFNDQSIDLIKSLKKDYIGSKITLDKCQHTIKCMLENLNDNKQPQQK